MTLVTLVTLLKFCKKLIGYLFGLDKRGRNHSHRKSDLTEGGHTLAMTHKISNIGDTGDTGDPCDIGDILDIC